MNSAYFYILTVSVCISSFNFGYNLAIFNPLSPRFKLEKYGIGLLCPVGGIFGAMIGNMISSRYGRRRCIFMLNYLNIIGNSMSMLLIDKLIPGLIIGRFICGVSVGMSAFIVPLYIREIAPSEIYARLGAFNQVMISFGIFISILIAICIKNDDALLIVIFMLPVFVSVIQIILFRFLFRNETATYYLKEGNKQKALLLMSELYFKNSSLMETDEYLMASQMNFVKESGYTDLFNSENWKHFKVGCILSALQQMSGINYITFTSCSYMEDSTHFTPGIATLIIGLIAFVSSLIAVFILRENYKYILQIGAIGMSLSYFIVLVLIYWNLEPFDIIYLTCTLLFIVCFECSIGPILWVFCADMLSEKGISLSFSINFLFSLIAGGVVTIDEIQKKFEYKKDSQLHQGLFFAMNSVFMLSCLAVRFMQIFIVAKYILVQRTN